MTSVGGHHDLRRVLRFLIHNEIETPSGIVHRQAHEYGLVVLLYGNLEQFVPACDLAPMRAGFKAWLKEDRKAARELAKERTTPEANALWDLLEAGKLQSLGHTLGRAARSTASRARPRSRARGATRHLSVPVYLLHGAHDNVIPPSETDAATLELGDARHVALVSPLIEHVRSEQERRARR